MKYIFVSLFLLTSISALAQQRTEVLPESIQHEDESYQKARAEWINSMHRAEPGLNWKVIDEATRQAKSEAYYSSKQHHEVSIQSITQDTFANGKIVGSWSERGSKNICGRTHTADIDFLKNTIYVASAMGNIWKAEVGSSNWMILNDAHRFGDIRMLRQITTPKGKRLIAACNGPVAVRYSDDDGKTWGAAAGLDGPNSWGGIKRGIISADESTMYLVGIEWDYSSAWRAVSFLYRSTDQGKHFTKIGNWNVSSDLCDVWVSRDTTSNAYFIKQDSLFIITPGGKLQFVSYRETSGNSLLLNGKVENGETMLALSESSDGSSVYTATGAMDTWELRGSLNGTPFGANSFRISQISPLQFYLGTNEVHQWTEENGDFSVPTGWAEYYGDPATKLHADIDGIDIFKDLVGNEVTLFSTDGGTYLSTDRNESVENLTLDGIRTSQYYSTYTSAPPYVINAGSQDQGFQRGAADADGLLDMTQVISGDYGHLVSSDSGNSVWGDYPGFVIYYPNARNSAAAQSWDFKGNNKLWIPPVIAVPGNPKSVLVGCGDTTNTESHLWQLTVSGQIVSGSMLQYDFSLANKDRSISAAAYSPFNSNELYALSNDGYFFHSTNKGKDWTNSDSNSYPASHYFYGSTVLASKLVKGKLWIAGSGYSNPGVYMSNDNGITFMPADSGLPKTLVYGMVASNDEQYLFAATEVGPYIYSSQAGRWFDLQAANGVTAPDMVFWSVEKVPQRNIIRFGTHGRGIWDFTFDTVKKSIGDVKTITSNTTISITAIPSIARTTVRFEVSSAEMGSIAIYDIEGRRIKAFSSIENPVWEVSSVPTGFYTAILQSKGAIAATKIEIIK